MRSTDLPCLITACQASIVTFSSLAASGYALPVHKPLHWTSFDVVKKLKNVLRVKKIGHAGTLDPLATGLLLLCVDRATKQVDHYQALGKVYTGELVIGRTTPSIDLETPFDSETCYKHITVQDVRQAAQSLEGSLKQLPPMYSAVKRDGKRAYQAARQGQALRLLPRLVSVDRFSIVAIDLPIIQFEIHCSKGTYVRSLVRDLGERLGVGAYLQSLCRTQIGPHRLEEAWELHTLVRLLEALQ